MIQGTRITDPAVIEQLKAARERAPHPENGKAIPAQPRGPRFIAHRPLWKKLVGKGQSGGCSSCQGEPWGWVQRQITTPRRVVRFLSWLVTLLPRGWEFARVVLSRRVSEVVRQKRAWECMTCDSLIVVVNEKRRVFVVNSYCGACQCPEWIMARLFSDHIPRWLRWLWKGKNAQKNWECPRHLHDGPYRGDAVRAEIARRQTEWRDAHKSVSLPIVGGGTDV